MTNEYLKDNYKRIRKELAYTQYPVFEQYKHKHIPQGTTEKRLEILSKQTW